MTLRFVAAAFCVISSTVISNAAPSFVNRAPAMGIQHVYDGGWEHFVGGGVAIFDCNGDRYPDMFVAGGENPSRLLTNQVKAPGDALVFTQSAPMDQEMFGVTGAYPLDIDSDGLMDLFVLRAGANKILKGLGNCRFEDAGDTWNFDGSDRWSTAFSALWEEGQNLPTLAVGNYVNRDDPKGPFRACDDNYLHRPVGDTYRDVSVLSPGYCALSMLISDWNRSGKMDLRISNDRHYYVSGGSEQLVRLGVQPSFYATEDGWQDLSIWGMGISSRDISGDGVPEVFLTSMGDQKLMLRAEGEEGPTYTAAPYARGTTATAPYLGNEGRPSSGWHAAFGDVDNDGLDDLFIAKGNVNQMPDSAMFDPNNLLMQQADGNFTEVGADAGLASGERGRGGGVVDLNRDGKLDIVVVNRRASLEIYENATETVGNWLQIDVRQPDVNLAAVGAWIEVDDGKRIHAREITIGGGHASGKAGFEHFGLGAASDVRFRIIWPDGNISAWQNASANQHIQALRSADGLEVTPY